MFASKEVHVAIQRWGWGFNNIIKSSLTCNCKFSFIFETISISILLQNAAHPQIMHNMSKLLLEMCIYVCKPETTRVLLIVCPYKPVLMIRIQISKIPPPPPFDRVHVCKSYYKTKHSVYFGNCRIASDHAKRNIVIFRNSTL